VILLLACRSHLEQAKACYRVGDFPRARTLFEKAVSDDPLSFEARYGLVLVMQEMGLQRKALGIDKAEDWSEVVQAYEICTRLGGQASTFSQNYSFALFHLANKLYQEQRYGAARDYLQQARKIEPRNKYTLNLAGVVAYNLGEYKEAQEIFEYLLALDPDFLSAYLNLGNVFWESRRWDEALATWKQGLGRSPGEPTLLRRLEAALQTLADG
jgi:tetratricopeptide (TPR) repeat protein